MRDALIGGVVLGVGIAGWTLVMGVTGWYADPERMNAFWMVVFVQLAVLVMLIWRGRRERGFGRQVATGFVASLIGGAIAFGNSLLFTTVLFPDYFERTRAVTEAQLRGAGMSEAEVAAQLDALAPMQTPVAQAAAGLIGTALTGLVASLILAAFLRKR